MGTVVIRDLSHQAGEDQRPAATLPVEVERQDKEAHPIGERPSHNRIMLVLESISEEDI
jgi:hypothetical protein